MRKANYNAYAKTVFDIIIKTRPKRIQQRWRNIVLGINA